MELLSRGIKKELWNIEPHLRREVRVGNPDSNFQLHIKGVNLLQQTISTLVIFLKSLIMIANIYGVGVLLYARHFCVISFSPNKNPMIGTFFFHPSFKDTEPEVQKG